MANSEWILAENDSLNLAANDLLEVEKLVNHGSISGYGTIMTDCALIVNDGFIAETITLDCLNNTARILIEEFVRMEDVFSNERERIEQATVANDVPMTREDYQNL